MTTLLALADDPNDATLRAIASRVGTGNGANLLVKRWTSSEGLRAEIEMTARTTRIDCLDIVSHGDRGECGISELDLVFDCFENKCALDGIARVLAPAARVRILVCEFAASTSRVTGWSFDAQMGVQWLADQMSSRGRRVRVSATETIVRPGHFDHTGFIGSSLPMLSAQ